MRRFAFRLLFVLFNVALSATLVIAILGVFTSVQHSIGRLISVAVLFGIALWAVDPSVNGRFFASEYLWPVLRVQR